MGIYSASFGMALVFGPWAGLRIYDLGGPETLWKICVGVGGLSTFLFVALRRNERGAQNDEPFPDVQGET